MATRYPSGYVRIGGARLPFISASVSRSAKRHSDTFSARLSITKTAEQGFDLAEWTDWDPQDVTIVFSTALGGADEREMVTGLVDVPNVSLETMQVSISGRDKSAALTEKRRNEKFANQKPKDIAGKIAKDHGLTLSFQGQSEFSGHVYDQDTANLILNRTDFEAMSTLAEMIGYRWYVDGTTLYMEPKDQGIGAFDLVWIPPQPGQMGQANVRRLSLRRNTSAARPHQVKVKSWHHRSNRLFSYEAKVDGRGNPLAYEFHHNGKNQAQVEQLAKSRLKDAIRHDLGITFEGPGDLTADVRMVCNLSGTGTIFDQAYAADDITWDMDYGGEFTMVVTANAAKKGRDPDGAEGSSGSPGATGGQAQGPPAPIQNAPLPPKRPAGMGGGGSGTVSV
jgi:phage protein D